MTTTLAPTALSDPPALDLMPRVEVLACHACGQVHWLPPMGDYEQADCTRCGSGLSRRVRRSIDRALACYLGALFLFYVANAYPILSMSMQGRTQTVTIVAGADGLARNGMPPLAAVVLLVGTLLPLAKILGNLYVLLPLRLDRRPPALGPVFRWVGMVQRWAMMEVYLLGLIVAYVKLGDLAEVGLGVAAFAFVALILVMLAGDANLAPAAVWSRVAPQAGPEVLRPEPGTTLLSCESCAQLARLRADAPHPRCPRCAAPLHRRKPESMRRTWALLLAAAFLYIPANLLPVMTVIYFGQGSPSTILGGIRTLIEEGMVPVALLVFVASITVPLVKLVGLAWLLISVQRRSAWRPRDRTLLYRIIEGIGRWSMVDVFMIAILTALVQLGSLASVEPDLGAVAFASVVVITMLSAMTFDPRLIWDVIDDRAGHQAPPRV